MPGPTRSTSASRTRPGASRTALASGTSARRWPGSTPSCGSGRSPLPKQPRRRIVTAQGPTGRRAVADTTEARENRRKVREGLVASTGMDKTIVVRVVDRVRHPRYDKTVQRTTKFLAHDELNDARVGDRVRIRETRPLSKRKRWHLVEILERAR